MTTPTGPGARQTLFPVQRSWSSSTVVGADEANQNIRDAIGFLLSPPRCIVYCANPQQFNSGNPPQPYALDTVLVDTGNMWNSSFPSRIYMPLPGVFQVKATIHYPYTATANTSFQLGVALNSNGVWPTSGSPQRIVEDTRPATNNAAFGTSLSVRGAYPFVQGDYIEIFTEQTTGSAFAPAGGQFASQVSVRWRSPS